MNIVAHFKKVSHRGSLPGVCILLALLVVVAAGVIALRAPTVHRSDTSCDYSLAKAPELKVTFGIGDVVLTASISLPCRLGASA